MKDPVFDTLAERFADHTMDVDPGMWSAISGKLVVASGSSLSGLLQEKFTGHEAPVDPQVWTSISSQLGHGVAAGVGSTTGWWSAGIAATLVAGGFLLYNFTVEPAPSGIAEQAPTSAPIPAEKQPIATELTNEVASVPTLPEAIVANNTTASTHPASRTRTSTSTEADKTTTNATNGTSLSPPPTPEGEKTVITVLQDIVDNYVTSPIVVVTEPPMPPPSQEEMPSQAVHAQHDEPVEESVMDEPELPEAAPAPALGVMIPTAFSPNGDGVNDELKVTVQNYQKAVVRIFSASSNALVFSADNLEAAWNGGVMNSGQPCEPGMYFYALEVTDAEGRTWSKGEVVRLFQR